MVKYINAANKDTSNEDELVDLLAETTDGKWVKIFENIPESIALDIWRAGFKTHQNKFSIESERSRQVQEFNRKALNSSTDIEIDDYTGKPFSFQHGNRRFTYRIVADNELIRSGQVTQIHPYDDAEYTWAKISGPVVSFIRDGKVIDKMTIYEYDEDNYENGFDEYVGDILDTIAVELINFDRDVEPRMIHN